MNTAKLTNVFLFLRQIDDDVSIDSEENNEGEDRLRFYLKDSNNNNSKPDSVALTVKDGQQRIVIDASHIEGIELSQKTGYFQFKVDGTYKVL